MREMIEERRDAKAQGVERADVFTNLLNASESEKGDGGALSDLELNGASSPFCLGCISHCPLYGRRYCEPFVANYEFHIDWFLVHTACGRT